uniref:RNA helicase n=1 Tax=Sphaeramia orbicularis TaxID=375764 RepID=A0A672ZQ87_9TELE
VVLQCIMSNVGRASQRKGKSQSSITSRLKEIHIDEELKITVGLALERLQYGEETEMEFPSSLTSTERAYIHRMAQSQGLISKSTGKRSNRFLTVRKKNGSEKPRPNMALNLSHKSLHFIRGLLQRFPLTNREHAELNSRSCMSMATEASGKRSGGLKNSIPSVPHRRRPSELDSFRRSLPVFERQEEIVQLIRENRVVLVVGETGSGKTTQIPQFLLDDCSRNGEPCRIFCTQPRRLAAIAVAERVAAERGECVGQTVGYHIRLENRVSPMTLLTFCTSGVFLRTLMAGDVSLTTVTHVIVDEVHERDGLTDFLLTKMRDLLQKIPTLKLILSSAALDIDLFIQYFGSCPVIHIKGRQFEVQELFLEDILRMTGFKTKDMKKYKEDTQRGIKPSFHTPPRNTNTCHPVAVSDWACLFSSSAHQKQISRIFCQSGVKLDNKMSLCFVSQDESSTEQLEPWLKKEMDQCISNIFLSEDQDAFTQIFNLILHENVNVDYTHSVTGTTALMVAAGQGFLPQMQQLLSLGADINIKASNGWTALDFAKHFDQTDAIDLLKSSMPLVKDSRLDEVALVQDASGETNTEDNELLKLYHHSFDDEYVDLDLIMDLLHNICSTTTEGAILVFLPGYDEIVSLRHLILYDDKRFSIHTERYQVFTLHSDMQTIDQKKAMKTSPPGVRKIILSTNIAETSITINDVVFVIDSGKVKEKSYDTLSHASMLKTVWVSKASALQRKGRAGRCRPGICFHLFSRLRFNNMLEFQVPQLLRMALQELCLQTKLLAPTSCTVAEFLSKAPQPPSAHAIKNAVQRLKAIDAMDQDENLTDLGYHLADLPLEPHLGKMVLCAVVLKCLDPILTIACILAYRDPFILPAQGSHKQAALKCRKAFTSNSFSDHMGLLRAFQAWQRACSEGWERAFCEENFLSQATMDMILGMRTQLMGQLRALGFVRTRGASDIRDVNVNSENWAVVKAALVAGMYPNLVHIDKSSVLSSDKEKKVHFHPTSILSQIHLKEVSPATAAQALPTDWLLYDEMRRGHRMASVRCCSLVTHITVAIFSGGVKLPSSALNPAAQRGSRALNDDSDGEAEDLSELQIDQWIVFAMDRQAAENVFELKQKWQNLFNKKIRCPSKPRSEEEDEALINTLVSVLMAEEQEAGLHQPTGIGRRPRLEPLSGASQEGPHTHTSMKNHKKNPQLSSWNMKDRQNWKNWGVLKLWTGVVCCIDVFRVNSPLICACSTQIPLALAPNSIQFFVMKSSNLRNIEISQQKGIWSTTPGNEAVLSKAFMENKLIILFFSAEGSGHFQGFARMTSPISRDSCQNWGLQGPGSVFSIEWIHKKSIPFQQTQHILNPWNDNKKVQISRDGQVSPPIRNTQCRHCQFVGLLLFSSWLRSACWF